MQRLLKFSCHNCGAKLAVPVQMSGLSDNCPKCGTLVTSPAVPAEAAPIAATKPTPSPSPVPVQQGQPAPMPTAAPIHAAVGPAPVTTESWSAEQLADALRPKAPKPVSVGVEQGAAPGGYEVPLAREKRRAPATQASVGVSEKPASEPAFAPAPTPTLVASPSVMPTAPEQAPGGPLHFPQAPTVPSVPVQVAAPTPASPAAAPSPLPPAAAPLSEPEPAASQPVVESRPAPIAEVRPANPAPEAPVTPTPAERPKAKEQPDLFQSTSPFPPAPQLPGLVTEPDPPAVAAPSQVPTPKEEAAPAGASTPSSSEEGTLKALTSRGTGAGQDSRFRAKLQSISRLPLEQEDEIESFLKDDDEEPAAASAPLSALMPRSLPDTETAEKAAQPGMGEMMASSPGTVHTGPMLLPPQESRPWQRVPLLTVGASPRRARRLRLNRIAMVGVIAFLMVDLLVVLWFCRKPIAAWLNTPAKSGPVVTTPPPATNGAAETPSTAGNEASMSIASPSDSSQTNGLGSTPNPAPTPDGTPPSPSPTTNEVSNDAPVPMAIPVTDFPGEPNSPSAAVPVSTPAAEPGTAVSVAAIPTPSAAELTPTPAPMPTPALTVADQPPTAPVVPAEMPASPVSPAASDPPATLAMAGIAPLAPPPLPSDIPGGVGGSAAAVPADNGVPYGGLPPPPPDMALPNGPIPPPDAATPEPALTLANTPAAPPKVNRVPKEAQTALVVLQKFLTASTWSERLPLVQKGETLRSAMEKSAAKFGDGPIRVGQIDFVERYVNKNGVPPYCMFELSGGSLEHPVLTLVEQSTKGGVKVDWEAFVDFKESLLLKFLENNQAGTSNFRVMLRRKHYFDKDVPDVTSKEAYEVKQPHGPFQGHIFVPKGTNLSRQLANQLGWGMDMPVIAELTWRTDGKHHWVEMVGISSYGWRG